MSDHSSLSKQRCEQCGTFCVPLQRKGSAYCVGCIRSLVCTELAMEHLYVWLRIEMTSSLQATIEDWMSQWHLKHSAADSPDTDQLVCDALLAFTEELEMKMPLEFQEFGKP